MAKAVGLFGFRRSDAQYVARPWGLLGEVTSVFQYDGVGVALTCTPPSASLLRAYTTYDYDDQGRVYQTEQYSVDPSSGAVGGGLITNFYYDHRGDLIAESDPGGLWTKSQYDGDDRLVDQAETDGDGGDSWSAASTLAGDHVLTQTLTTYDADGNPILVTTKDRFDSDTDSDLGPLGNANAEPDQARVSYTAYYYDTAGRLTASVDVGTNGGVAYAPPTAPPANSATAQVTTYDYDLPGLPTGNAQSPYLVSTTDPRGIVTQDAYDLAGDVVQTIDAYEPNVNNGLPTNSANQTTDYAYIYPITNGQVDGFDYEVTAVMPNDAPGQTTAYIYGASINTGSELNSNDLLDAIEYPDPTTGLPSTNSDNQQTCTYDALGDIVTSTDPNGTTHTYAYDPLGRETSDTVTTLGAGVDGAEGGDGVMGLTVTYDSAGLPDLYTSLNATNGVVNQVQDFYNGFGELTGEYQSLNGKVTASTPEVQYTYNDPATGGNNARPTSMVYPDGRTLNDVYDSTGTGQSALDSSISRVSTLQDGTDSPTPGQTLEAYTYLGLDTIVQRDYAQPGIELSDIEQSGETNLNTSGGDKYTGLNQFGEVVDQNWINTNTGASVERLQYAYDADGDVLYEDNLVDTALSQLYGPNGAAANSAYDPLGRITAFEQGTLSASVQGGPLNTVAAPTSTQSWQLDALGNWTSVTTNGSTTSRLFNSQNQTIDATGQAEPGYDLDGNTTSDNGQLDVYDAWGRLVAVNDGTNGDAPLATYSYDALGRRVTEYQDSTGSTTYLYYDSSGQVIEERLNGTAASNVSQQYVWSLSYVNAMVLRDSFSGGALTERLYALQDANYDTTALVNTSGTVVEQYTYTPYGTVTVLNASGQPVAGNESAYGWQYLFQGGRLDAVTGWYEFGARDYIPTEGRWAERDPLGQTSGDLNIYRFEANDPLDSIDPTGLEVRGDNHCYPLHLGGHPRQPMRFLGGVNHTRFHDYFRARAMGPRSGAAGRALWAAMSPEEQQLFLIRAMRYAKIPQTWISTNIGSIMYGAKPGFNMSPYRYANKAALAKLTGVTLGVAFELLGNPSTAFAAEVALDWRDPTQQQYYGDRQAQCQVAPFTRVVMVPTGLNPFSAVDTYDEQKVGPWQDLGPTTAAEAAAMENITSQKTLFSNPLYTIYEYRYYRSRWGGVQNGLPGSDAFK